MNEAVAALRAGQAVILPTDTVYGLCALPEHEDVLFELKGRDRSKPVALIAADIDVCSPRRPRPRRPRALLPGPVHARLRERRCARPEPPVRKRAEVVREVGVVAATSANLSGGPDPRRVEDVPEEIRAAVGAIVDAGELPGTPSTVIDLRGDEPVVLRQAPARCLASRKRHARLGEALERAVLRRERDGFERPGLAVRRLVLTVALHAPGP